MKLTNYQLINYVNQIKFSTTDKSDYKDQIENLVEQLESYIAENTSMSAERVLQAGSWRKGTILLPGAHRALDIDLAFYIDSSEIEDVNDFHEINSKIVELLMKIYPNKSKDDFKENPKTANVKFITSGLSVDIVPVISIPRENIYDLPRYVYQPDSETYEFYITSIKDQISFIVERKRQNQSFTAIVRIIKEWRNLKKVPLSSFAIELIVSYLDISKKVMLNIEEAILRAFTLLSSRYFPEISFGAPVGAVNNDANIYIADPTNNSNNVTKYISGEDWNKIKKEAEKALDTLSYAQEKATISETVNLWKEVFDANFNIDSK